MKKVRFVNPIREMLNSQGKVYTITFFVGLIVCLACIIACFALKSIPEGIAFIVITCMYTGMLILQYGFETISK